MQQHQLSPRRRLLEGNYYLLDYVIYSETMRMRERMSHLHQLK